MSSRGRALTAKAENGDRLVEAGSSPWTRVDGLHREAPQHLSLLRQWQYYQEESSLERVLETLLDFIQTPLRHHLGSIGLHFGSIFCAQKDEP